MYQIFIVDDDLTVQRELKILLENHGYRATLAKNFTNIPEEIEEQRPDLVLLDISLPSEDGIMLENTHAVRCSDNFCYITKFISGRVGMYA